MVERSTLLEDDRVRLTGPFSAVERPGLAPRGQDARKGEAILLPGTRIEASHLGILAAVGQMSAVVARRPRVEIITTGDEVVEPAVRPSATQIRNSNGPQLKALLQRSALAETIRVRKAKDDRRTLRRAIESAGKADVLVLTGGVSMGEYDFVPEILRECGYRIHLHRVALRPGRPFLFGTQGGRRSRRAVFGLPGNPVSVLATAWELLFPYLRRVAGAIDPEPPTLGVRVAHPIRRPQGLTHFVLGRLFRGPDGDLWVRTVPYNSSGDYLAVGWADCLIPLPEEDPEVAEGQLWHVHPLFRAGV